MLTGLLFGSFNPVHTGHLLLANHLFNEAGFKEIWFVVSPQNPLKDPKKLLSEYDRLAMVDMAIENDSRFRSTNIEFLLPKPSYTIQTLCYLSEKYPSRTFCPIIGTDNLKSFHRWKNYLQILEHYTVYAYNRKESMDFPSYENVVVLDAPLIEISSSQIRELIKRGKSVRYLVPDNVREYIDSTGFYKT